MAKNQRNKNEGNTLKDKIAEAYLDLTSEAKRNEALGTLVGNGAIHSLGARMFKDRLADLQEVYDGAELGERLSKVYMEVKQPILYAINGEDVEPEEGIYKGNKILEDFKKKYKRE